MAAPPGALRLVDFGSSLFWTLAGVVSVGATVTAINQRVRAQEEHVALLRERNALAAELCRAQGDAGAARSKLQLLEQQLEGASGYWWRPLGEQLARTAAAAPPGGQQQAAAAAASSGGSSRPAQR